MPETKRLEESIDRLQAMKREIERQLQAAKDEAARRANLAAQSAAKVGNERR